MCSCARGKRAFSITSATLLQMVMNLLADFFTKAPSPSLYESLTVETTLQHCSIAFTSLPVP